MGQVDHPSLLYVARDARDADAAQAAMGAGGWAVTAAISAAHATRILERERFDVVALDPRVPGAADLVAVLANRRATTALYLGTDADTAKAVRAGRDRGIFGCGPLAKLAGLASTFREGERAHVVGFTTVLRVAWLARITVAVQIGVADGGNARQVVVWLEHGEPVDATFGTARGVDAVARLVPGSTLSGPVSDVATSSVVTEYETTPLGRTIRCGMLTLLDLFDDDAPFVEITEEEVDADLWLDGAWASRPPPDDPAATDLVARAAGVDGVLAAVVVDATGAVVASVGTSASGPAEAVELWSALAVAVGASAPDDAIQEVVVASSESLDVLCPIYEEARVLHVRFARRSTNHALAVAEVKRLCTRASVEVTPLPQRASSLSSESASRETTP